MSRSFSRHFLRSIASAVVAAACLFAGATTAQAQGLYKSQAPSLNTTTTPANVASADFALSGFRSLAVTVSNGTNRNSTNYVEVFLGTGAASFGSGVNYATCKGATGVLAQDFNGDGYPDLAVACPFSDTVDIFFNNGASSPGTFGAANPYTANNAVAMVAGDFRNNGQIDLVVAISSGGITYLKNNNGNFTASTAAAAGTGLSGITAGDFNHDGNLDLALSDTASNNVHVLLGTGTGTFGAQANYNAGAHTNGIQTADFDNNGNLDLAVTTTGNNVAILLGSTTGAFTLHSTTAAGTGSVGLEVTDVNNDGAPDVIAFDALSTSTGEIAVLLGNGDGTLQPAQISTLDDAPGMVATVDDFNRDGKPDLAVTQTSSNQVSVLLNNTLPTAYPDGRSFEAVNNLTVGYGNMADSVAVGDFNKDGRLDIAASYLEDNVVRVLINNGSGFNTAVSYAVGKQPYWVASGDVNGDGYPDLVTANTTDGTVSVLLNNGKTGNGTFKTAATYTVGKQPYQVAIGDVNGDGFPDLAVSNYGANTVTILTGSKTGIFTPAAATLSTCANPYGVAIGDFKHNGFPSVAVTCYSAAQMEVFPNNGNGTFGTPTILTTDINPASLVVGDFNRDNKLDIVVGNTTANDVYFFAGNGLNGFGAGVMSPSLNFPDSIAAGDVNGDGILDIVGVAPNFNNVVVTLGVGNGTFGTFQQRSAGEFAATKQPWAVALGDFNNDGHLDIVTANTFSQINIASPAYQARYIAQYPPIPAGNPSIDVLTNASTVNITVTSSPSPIPPVNSGTTIKANVSPALSGSTPTGSVMFEDATGAPVGSGPYSLAGGVATYAVGHLGSGAYLFTSLYSGDANFQPATVSGSGAAITVAGTPVTLSLSPSSVNYGNTFVATVTAIGNTTTGSYPHGTATIYIDTGTTSVAIGTTTAFTQVGFGHNSSRTITITATAPNLNAGSYELYAVFNPSSGAYTQGSSSDEPLTVVPTPPTPVALSLAPTTVPFGNSFVATVNATGNTTTGSYPHGTASIYIDNGGTPILIGTTTAFAQVGGGNDSRGTVSITTSAPNLNIGTYHLYAVFNPTTPPYYGSGTSADVTLIVAQPPTPTSTTVSCTGGFLGGTCTSTTTVTTTGLPVTAGNTVNFSGAGTSTQTTNAAGKASFNFAEIFGNFTVMASFPAQGTYAASSNTTPVLCFFICGLDRGTTTSLNSLSGMGFGNFAGLFANQNVERNTGRNIPFSLF